MKVLLTHRFFWPDTAPYGLILRAIGDSLAEAGHEVNVLSSIPSYRDSEEWTRTPRKEQLGALKVHRTWVFEREKSNPLRRLANAVLYCACLFREIRRLRPDVVTASTFPPVVAAWVASLAARSVGAKFIYHIQDIHPELSELSGGLMGRGIARRVFTALDNGTLRHSAVVVTLSEDLLETLRARVSRLPKVVIANNPPLEAFGAAANVPKELRCPAGTRRIIFAGNLGRFQNLFVTTEGIVQVLDRHPDTELMFLGDGAALPELKARWGYHSRVRFGPFLPFSVAKELIAESAVGLVSLSEGIHRVAYPSKISTYLALGVPVLAIVDRQSGIARDLIENNFGRVPIEETPEAIASQLEEMLANLECFTPRSVRIAEYVRTWLALCEYLEEPGGGAAVGSSALEQETLR